MDPISVEATSIIHRDSNHFRDKPRSESGFQVNMEDAGCVTPVPNPSEISHKSQDSGFSDSEGHGAVVARGGVLKSSTKSQTFSLTINQKNEEYKVSCEDLSNIPPPPHSSTPKAKDNPRWMPVESPIPKEWACPVNLWLSEVRYLYDPECTSTLQNKPITAGLSEKITATTSMAVNTIRNLHRQLTVVCSKLNTFYRKLRKGNLAGSPRIFERIIQRMERILTEHNENSSEPFDCSGLLIAFETLSQNDMEISNLKTILKTVAMLFSKKIEQILIKYIKILVDLLKQETSPPTLVVILSGLGNLGLQAPHLADLLANCAGITSLLSILVNCASPAVHTATLNLLSTVCCTPESVRQFECSGGLELLCEILSNDQKRETEHCGAISLFVQVTAPWLDVTVQELHKHLDKLVPSITRLIRISPSTEMLLLCAAALANISWIEVRSVWPLVCCGSVGVLLRAVRILGPKASVFLKEQAATLLANMSAASGVLPHLTRNRAVPALLCFLQVSLSPLQSAAERAATFRVQHKAVIALSRLCSDPEAAKQIVELQGVSRIVRLCKEESERNNSDGVLVACLVALRKVASHCGSDTIKSLNASELVEPKLLESFLLYSSNQFKSR